MPALNGTPTQFLVFSTVGLIATGLHYAVLLLLVIAADADPVASSTIGYVAGALTSYWLNYNVTFRSTHPHLGAILRFMAIAGVGLLLNSLLMLLAIKIFELNYLLSQFVATLTVLLWNYWGNRNWTFRGDDNELLQNE